VTSVLIVRAQPGAGETAARAAALGLEPVVAPIFKVGAAPWDVPAERFDAVIFTSAQAPRLGGGGLAAFTGLPCYAVGETTAAAARAAGFADVKVGTGDADALLDVMIADRVGRALHLCGREHKALDGRGPAITRRVVYTAQAIAPLPDAAVSALRGGALALLHSPRGAAHFAQLVDAARIARAGVRIAAISPAAAAAAGSGWASSATAAQPRDQALLELAAKLCNIAGRGGTGSDG